jgi:hypothetical protein
MSERPISFGASMMLALLASKKNHTRRTKSIPQEATDWEFNADQGRWRFYFNNDLKPKYITCPYGVVGSRLWVKEMYAAPLDADAYKPSKLLAGDPIYYFADESIRHKTRQGVRLGKMRPAMFMPRALSRVLLEVESVECVRLQSITALQAVNEGIDGSGAGLWRDYSGHTQGFADPRLSFASLWDSINGSKTGMTWADNPLVWDIGFKVLEVKR